MFKKFIEAMRDQLQKAKSSSSSHSKKATAHQKGKRKRKNTNILTEGPRSQWCRYVEMETKKTNQNNIDTVRVSLTQENSNAKFLQYVREDKYPESKLVFKVEHNNNLEAKQDSNEELFSIGPNH